MCEKNARENSKNKKMKEKSWYYLKDVTLFLQDFCPKTLCKCTVMATPVATRPSVCIKLALLKKTGKTLKVLICT